MKDSCSRNRIALLAVVAIMLHVFAAVSGRGYEDHNAQAAPAAVAVDQPTTRAVQLVLKSFGYTIAVDGVYGPQTTKVVKSWQKSNGLTVDGVAGPETQASLGLSTTPATRVGNAQPIGGLNGLPFAPEGLSDCDEAHFYRVQAGLPDHFDALIWRESNCRNEDGVHTSCCWGYLQLHSMHFRPGNQIAQVCQAVSYTDVNSDNSLEKQKQMCAAKLLYDAAGYSPWAL